MFEDALGSTAPRPDLTASDRYQAGDTVDGRFVVLSKLGAGGMGTVLKVHDSTSQRERALKYCEATGENRQRFDREVRIMQRIGHIHLVPVFHANLDHHPPYFVMPLAIRSLADELGILKADEGAALLAFKQACLGVQALHLGGAVHRDLKPHNLLRFGQLRNHVAVADLGLAKLEDRDTTALTQTRMYLGTDIYMAPEQFEEGGSRDCDVRTDIYQLGLILYQLLTGRSPRGVDASLLPSGLDYIVRRATNTQPESRFASVGEILDALGNYEVAKLKHDSREAFENLIQEANDLIKQGQSKSENVRGILSFLARLDPSDHKGIFNDFDRIPDRLLSIVGADYSSELLPPLRLYTEAIRARVGGKDFTYAESVAGKMSRIFTASRNTEVQTLALQSILIAAVELNRFVAMGTFNRLLVSVQEIGLVLPVADMLRANRDYYLKVASGPPRESLAPAIRAVRDELLKPAVPVDDDDDEFDIPF